jgi:nucleotide-binding universal stress UspA family protein
MAAPQDAPCETSSASSRLTWHGECMRNESMKPILVPVDYSDHSFVVLQYAASLVEGLGAELHVLHVGECMPDFDPDLRVKTDGGIVPLSLIAKQSAERDMKDFLGKAAPAGAKLVEHVVLGRTAATILSWAESGKFDLIVIGTHGRGGLRRLTLGSVAASVVRLAAIPVITVPSRERASRAQSVGVAPRATQ